MELQEKHFVAKGEVEYPSGCHRFDVQNVVLRYLKGVRYKVKLVYCAYHSRPRHMLLAVL